MESAGDDLKEPGAVLDKSAEVAEEAKKVRIFLAALKYSPSVLQRAETRPQY